MYFLYRHIRKDNREPFYIGVGTVLDEYNTFKAQYYRAYNKMNRNQYWINIANKYGFDSQILFEHSDRRFIHQKEIEFISLYGRKSNGGLLVNMTDGGDGVNNLDRETRERITKFITGKPRSKETKRKLSEAFKGRKMSNDTKKRMSDSRTGTKLSEATKNKIRKSHLGRKLNDTTNVKKAVIKRVGISVKCLNNDKIYDCCRDACVDIFGKNTNALSNNLRNGINTYNGYAFKILN